MHVSTTMIALGRWLTRIAALRCAVEVYLKLRTALMRRKGPLTAVLSLGENGHAYSAARAVHDLGHRVLLITDTPQLPEMAYADALIPRDPVSEIETIVIELENFELEAVMVSTEHILLPAQHRIASCFGLISSGAESAELNNNKLAWREALAAEGVPQPIYSRDPAIFEGQPCIRKPFYGGGSAGVIALKADADKSAYSGSDCFFEALIEGEQYDYEGVMENGDPRFLARIYERYINHNGSIVAHYFLFNPPIDPAWNEALEACVTRTLAASKVTNGAFHVEMRLDGDRALPIDFANRISGYERCVSFSAGEDFAKAHASRFLPRKHRLSRGEPHALVQFFCWTEAEFTSACMIRDANPDRVFDANMRPHMMCGEQCYGMIAFFHDNFPALLKMIDALGVHAPTPGGVGEQRRLAQLHQSEMLSN